MPQSLQPVRPFFRRGTLRIRPERRDRFATENQRRLAVLAGMQCPNCGEAITFDGSRLLCTNPRDCTYGWSNAECAEDEIYFGIS